MKTVLHKIKIGEIAKGFTFDKNEGKGLFGYNGKLTIQPEYQRNYIYEAQNKEVPVIESLLKEYPLGLFYWVDKENDQYEILDGQQRITSICRFIENQFSVKINDRHKNFHNLDNEQQSLILNTELLVYYCTGTDTEIKEWFETINIAGVPLNKQELLNAVYSGSFVTLAREKFSKSNGSAYQLANNYLKGSPIRQEYLETALNWVSNNEIQQYMATHQNDENINELWSNFQSVINWVNATFIEYYAEMKGIDWGSIYNKYRTKGYNTDELKDEISKLYNDVYVTDKKGVFEFVLTSKNPEDYKLLNVRIFDEKTKQTAYTKQKGICPICESAGIKSKVWDIKEMEADHITAWSKGGSSDISNCQMLCMSHNRAKGNR